MRELIINKGIKETRIAVLENSELSDLIIQNNSQVSLVGNIYKGRVSRVLPGMNAAFVDIGLEKAAFLFGGDVVHPEASIDVEGTEEGIIEELPEASEAEDKFEGDAEPTFRKNLKPIEELISEGQEILVQIAKDPISTKGARVTTFIAFAGQYLVHMPFYETIGVSRKITSEKERDRLKDALKKINTQGGGLIARTSCENISVKRLKEDADLLVKTWREVQRNMEKAKVPSLINEELDVISKTLRDYYSEDLKSVVIDDRKSYRNLVKFATRLSGKLRNCIQIYNPIEPIFDHYGIEMEITRALEKKVWLKSGGYIIVEQTEAFVTIDVNTGRFVGKRNLEETILKTNLEAVKEIAHQIKLRNMGGIIVIDFIDMEKQQHREKVQVALEECLKKDKARTNMQPISALGLVEMTRKRTGDSLWRKATRPCPYCEGSGAIKSTHTIITEIFRDVMREANNSKKPVILVYAPNEIAQTLIEDEKDVLHQLEALVKKKIVVKADPAYHLEEYDIFVSE